MTTPTTLNPAASSVAIVRRPKRLRSLWLLVSLVVLAGLMLASVMIGSREVSWAEIMAALGGSIDGFGPAAVATRIPRTLLAVVAGAALALSGAVMQGVTRNPLADPGILGVNVGASLAVVCGMAYFGLTSASEMIWVAIVGAGATAVFVYTIGSLGRGGSTPLKLALAGAATSAALASFVTAVVLPRNDIAEGVRSWQIGGVGGATLESIRVVAPFLLVGLIVSLLSARSLNSLALGDDLAAGLGERVAIARAAAAIGAVVLCGAITAVAGPIGFVGLVVPHVVRLTCGPLHGRLLPLSALGGATLLVWSDTVARSLVDGQEIPIGVVTAVVGAPVFAWLLRREARTA